MAQTGGWPEMLWIARHGESVENTALHGATAQGAPTIDLATREVDAPLTALGEQQARALGRWFGGMRPGEQPRVILTSPYVRALRTAELLRETGRFGPTAPPLVVDERLREKDGGLFEGLTLAGVAQRYPEQAALRRVQGKFYHRPPGGESWTDVLLRLRSVLGTLASEYRDERVLMVSHAVVVLCLRYLLDGLTEAQVLEIDRAGEVGYGAVTAYSVDATGGGSERLRLRCFNWVPSAIHHQAVG